MSLLAALYIGLDTHLFVGMKIEAKLGKDLVARFDNKIRLEKFRSDAIGIKPLNEEFFAEIACRVANKGDRGAGVYIGVNNKCFHVFDREVTYDNQLFGKNMRVFVEVKR